jgi:hypothetical protein
VSEGHEHHCRADNNPALHSRGPSSILSPDVCYVELGLQSFPLSLQAYERIVGLNGTRQYKFLRHLFEFMITDHCLI